MVNATIALAVLAGVCLGLQAATNATLGTKSGRAFSSMVAFASGTVPLMVYWLVESHGSVKTDWGAVRVGPWWQYVGGPCGALYVLAAIISVPRIGSSAVLATAIIAQLATAVLLDNFSLFNLPQRTATAGRIVGLVLGVAGVLLITTRGSIGEAFHFHGGSHQKRGTRVDGRGHRYAVEEIKVGNVTPTVVSPDATAAVLFPDANPAMMMVLPPPVSAAVVPTKSNGPLIGIVAVGGCALAVQAAVNDELGKRGGNGLSAAFTFFSAAVILAVYFAVQAWLHPDARPARKNVAAVPWWGWTGGCLGACYVLIVVFIVGNLGAADTLGASVSAQ
ncbi:hypothetical protein BDK51DRAFT_29402, partial [Blyttiomyces helicus]